MLRPLHAACNLPLSARFLALERDGRRHLAAQRWKHAALTLAAALQIDAEATGTIASLGLALRQLGDPQGALLCYRRVLQLDPQNLDAWVQLAAVLNTIGRHEAAARASHRALALSPDNLEAALHLGHAFHLAGLPGEAAQCYGRIAALYPDEPRGPRSVRESLPAHTPAAPVLAGNE